MREWNVVSKVGKLNSKRVRHPCTETLHFLAKVMFIASSQHPFNFWVVPLTFNSIFHCLKKPVRTVSAQIF